MASQADIAQALQQRGVSVFGLRVEDAGGRTAVYGTVASEADRQKAEQAITSAAGANAIAYVAVQSELATGGVGQAAAQTYTVKSGDTLRKIAQRFYGDEMKWHAIRDANRDKLPDPDKIQVGMQLVIP